MNTTPYDRALVEARKASPNQPKVYAMLRKAERMGDPRATYALGTWMLHGHYVERNVSEGLRLIRKAASKDVPEALYDLAVSLELGNGTRKNDKKAALCYLRAALQGDAQAVFEVGRCYYYGIGLSKDKDVASAWLDRAKRLGTFENAKGKPRKVAGRTASGGRAKES